MVQSGVRKMDNVFLLKRKQGLCYGNYFAINHVSVHCDFSHIYFCEEDLYLYPNDRKNKIFCFDCIFNNHVSCFYLSQMEILHIILI